MYYFLLTCLLHLLTGVVCSSSQLQSVVDPKTWLPSWRTQCSVHLATSSVVANKEICHQLLTSCSDCCAAGYDRVSRECHVLRAEPLGVMTSGGNSLYCSQRCGTPVDVTTVWTDCGSLGVLNKGKIAIRPGIQGDTSFGAEANFTCQTGYFVNVTTLTCEVTGWSEPKPSCQVVDCGTPRTPTNGSINVPSATTYGSQVTYYCDAGFYFKDNPQSTSSLSGSCTANGTWSVENPQCERKYCPVLQNISNGWVNTSQGIQYQDVATYHCNEGYRLSGTQQLTCRTSAYWNGNAPTCQAINCSALSTTYGSFTYSSGTFSTSQRTVGSNANVTCNSQYYVSSGDTIRTCQANSSWTGNVPVCAHVCGTATRSATVVDDLCFGIFYHPTINWNTARSDCEARNATLVKLDTFTRIDAARLALNTASNCGYIAWIGLRYLATTAVYTWLDGSPFDSSAAPQVPAISFYGQSAPVVFFYSGSTGAFYARSSTETRTCVICEYPPIV